jgi:hypothetical protein
MFAQKSFAKVFHKYYKVLVLIIISAFLFLGFYNINFPGFQYDEVLYAPNLFVPCVENSFNTLVIKILNICFPILSMGYIGSLKSYLLYPFVMLGVANYYAVYRGVAVIIGAVSIYSLFILNKKLNFSVKTNLVVLTLLAFSTSFILGVKYDWGPSSVSILLKTLFLIFIVNTLFNLKKQHFFKNLSLVIFVSLLGIFNKFDFIFFVFAFAIPLVFYKSFMYEVFSLVKKHWAIVGSFTLIFIITATFLLLSLQQKILLFFLSDVISKVPLHDKFSVFIHVLSGNSVSKVIAGSYVYSGYEVFVLTFFVLFLLSILFLFFYQKHTLKSVEKYLLVSSLIYFLFLFLFPKSGGPHHFIASFPVVFVIFGVYLNKVMTHKFINLICVCFLAIYIFHSLSIYIYSTQQFKKGFVYSSWSKASEILYNEVEVNHKNKKVFITDWGVANQIIILSKGSIIPVETFRPISELSLEYKLQEISKTETNNSVAVKYYEQGVFKDAVEAFPFETYQNSKIIYYNKKPVYVLYY